MNGTALVLFDIDGTLVRTGGAGREAMVRAADRLYGRRDLFDGVDFAGSIDPTIVSAALKTLGRAPSPDDVHAFRVAYAIELEATLLPGRGAPCPGAERAVREVSVRATVGLLTGNWEEGARRKLGAYGLWTAFEGRPSAFGGDATHRDGLVPVAAARARASGLAPRRVVVVGDTPADVACARAGARALPEVDVVSVAVRTGFGNPRDLAASGPDLLIDDLERGLSELLAAIC